jgi:hypothetical protein
VIVNPVFNLYLLDPKLGRCLGHSTEDINHGFDIVAGFDEPLIACCWIDCDSSPVAFEFGQLKIDAISHSVGRKSVTSIPAMSASIRAFVISLIFLCLIHKWTAAPEQPISNAVLVGPPALSTATFTLF